MFCYWNTAHIIVQREFDVATRASRYGFTSSIQSKRVLEALENVVNMVKRAILMGSIERVEAKKNSNFDGYFGCCYVCLTIVCVRLQHSVLFLVCLFCVAKAECKSSRSDFDPLLIASNFMVLRVIFVCIFFVLSSAEQFVWFRSLCVAWSCLFFYCVIFEVPSSAQRQEDSIWHRGLYGNRWSRSLDMRVYRSHITAVLSKYIQLPRRDIR